jgi:beta-1,2-mannobiose phosphorylase / 1,2-beta-oligomannan phosphorylase
MVYNFIHSKRMVLEPVKDNPWASEMVLNPAIIKGLKSGRIHMLFRATGPWPQKRMADKPLPYPIFLGYGWSDDEGRTWQFDLERPALAPNLEYGIKKIYIKDYKGRKVVNHANGCIEDPRLFYFENECYVITACRMFPPGPYWEHDEPTQCCPDWISSDINPFGKAASENITVNVIFKVNLDMLTKKQYESAFEYVTNLTDPTFGEDRDVLVFPERIYINGQKKIVMLHRPFNPAEYPFIQEVIKPSIVICAADSLEDFSNPELYREVLAMPEFEWEINRIGGSAPPIRINSKEWLLCYHGKQDTEEGYTQSFMLLEEQKSGLPKVTHRCSERLIVADQDWEQPRKFSTPCVFITGMIENDGRLLASYGAADEKVGILEIDLDTLVQYICKY